MGSEEWITVAVAAATAMGSTLATRATLGFLRRGQILDRPNERSSHALPTPRGLGLGLIPVVLVGIIVVLLRSPFRLDAWVVVVGAACLSALSWIDDVRHLPAWPRLLAQVAFVVGGTAAFEDTTLFTIGGLPSWVGRIACVVIWVGIINQVNFTDGIDGHLGGFVVCLGLGLAVVSWWDPAGRDLAALALVLAAAAAGFLPLNWHPAKAFMGDVGSVPLGLIIGWLLLRFAARGHWIAIVVLPSLYLVDTVVTYAGRIARKERFWQPHRLYGYQRAARTLGHARTVRAFLICNAVLILVVVAAARTTTWIAALAALPVVLTYGYLMRAAPPVGEGR